MNKDQRGKRKTFKGVFKHTFKGFSIHATTFNSLENCTSVDKINPPIGHLLRRAIIGKST
jgi:hypothetical protein